MIQDKSLEISYSKSVDVKKYNINLVQNIVNKTKGSVIQFSFIDLSQWTLLLSLNIICLGFIVFVCNLIH